MTPESRERIEINRREIEINDANGDRGLENRVEYSDGSFTAEGKITDGPNAGKEWRKGKNVGQIDRDIPGLKALGFSTDIERQTVGDWGYMVQGGQNEGQPKAGDTWFKSPAHVEQAPESTFDLAELQAHGETMVEQDAQGRTTYKRTVMPDKGLDMVEVTSYHDAEGFSITTGKHLGPKERGKVWEVRRMLPKTSGQQTEASLQTPLGTMHDLEIFGTDRDLELSDEEKGLMDEDQTRQSTERMRRAPSIISRGRWESPAVE